MDEEKRRLLEECQRIYIEDFTLAHIRDDSGAVHQAVVEIMQRIDAVLDNKTGEE